MILARTINAGKIHSQRIIKIALEAQTLFLIERWLIVFLIVEIHTTCISHFEYLIQGDWLLLIYFICSPITLYISSAIYLKGICAIIQLRWLKMKNSDHSDIFISLMWRSWYINYWFQFSTQKLSGESGYNQYHTASLSKFQRWFAFYNLFRNVFEMMARLLFVYVYYVWMWLSVYISFLWVYSTTNQIGSIRTSLCTENFMASWNVMMTLLSISQCICFYSKCIG